MKRLLIGTALMLGAAVLVVPRVSAQFSGDAVQTMRTLTGQVQGSGGPVAGAVVYLKNTKTLAIKSFIADNGGNFRFPALSPNVDYEVYAESNGKRSEVKILSSLDSRQNPTVNLKLD